MKKIIICLISILINVSLFSESIKGINLGIGYRNNNFDSDGIEFKDNYAVYLLGYDYTLYPNYNSSIGFSINPMLFYNSNLFGVTASINSNNLPKDYKGKWAISGQIGGFTDIALNFRIPTDISKKYFFIRTGGIFQISNFKAVASTSYWGHEEKDEVYDGSQITVSGMIELGWQPRDTFSSRFSINFFYDLITKNPMTGNNFIHPNSFGIMLLWQPWYSRREFKKDKQIIEEYENNQKQRITRMLEKEDKYSKYYDLYDMKRTSVRDIDYLENSILNNGKKYDNSIFDIPLNVYYYRRRNETDSDWLEYSEPFIREIKFTRHTLSDGEPGTNNYILREEEIVTLAFVTDEDKQKAFTEIEQEYYSMREWNKRFADNNRLAEERQNALYITAVNSKDAKKLADYIRKNSEELYFKNEAYNEIAKIVSKNKNIQIKKLPSIPNPYSLDKNYIYIANRISVQQWTGNGTFLAKTDKGDMIFIRNVYDISAIGTNINTAYLKYAGSFEYNSTGAGIQVVAQFDLLYNIDGINTQIRID